MLDGDRIYGEGINIAARLESLAEPGGVCVSGPVWEQVRHKLVIDAEDLGEQAVKNIPDPVRVYRIRLQLTAVSRIPRGSNTSECGRSVWTGLPERCGLPSRLAQTALPNAGLLRGARVVKTRCSCLR